MWPHLYADGSDINAVDRSNSKRYLVTGDDFSKINLFRYPACHQKQIYNSYKGHSSHVTNIKFTYDDKFVISTGGLEKSIIQRFCEEQQDLNYDLSPEDEGDEVKEKNVMEEDENYEFEGSDAGEEKNEEQDDDEFGLEVEEGEQAMAVKPFLGQVKASTPLEYKTMKMKNVAP